MAKVEADKEVHEHHRAIIPGEVMYLLAEKRLDMAEVVLLAVVDSLVKTRGEGCWASNNYLARALGKSSRQIIRIVGLLKKMGLLVQVGTKRVNGRDFRVLETRWSRVVVDKCTSDTGVTRPVSPVSPNVSSSKILIGDGGLPSAALPRDSMLYEDRTPPEDTTRFTRRVRKAARLLRDFGAKMSWSTSRSERMWEKPLQTLANQVGDVLVLKVATWYTNNHPRRFRMKLADGAQFRRHFEKVRDDMQRDVADKEVAAIKVHQNIRHTVQDAKSRHWPKGSKADVPAFCQKTYEFAVDLYKKLTALNKSAKDSSVRFLAGYARGIMVPNPPAFVDMWVAKVHNNVCDWDDWHGKLLRELPRPGHRLFDRWGQGLAEEGCRRSEVWDSLMKEVYE